jgi:ppGpp synthetase/RelA/SpoT-type nucleotidyltranferase
MPDATALEEAFAARRPVLNELAEKLESRVNTALIGIPHIDRISFRAKTVDSFVKKATREPRSGHQAMTDPLREMEDQVAGRVIVFFREDISGVTSRIFDEIGAVEHVSQEPAGDSEFGYESDHFIIVIPKHLQPDAWQEHVSMPVTFEMQVRTLFMHAWAEPQHDLGYKPGVELTRDQRKKLAWVAASAWGADQVLNDVQKELRLDPEG